MEWRSARSDVLWNQSRIYGALRVSLIANEYFRTRPNPSNDIELPREGAAECPHGDRCPNSFRIPRGSLIQWLPHPSNGQGFTSVRWLQDDYIVSDAELNQNCERVLDQRCG